MVIIKKILLVLLVTTAFAKVNAQITPSASTVPDIDAAVNDVQLKINEPVEDTNAVYNSADQAPEYIGGPSALVSYLRSYLKYPPEAKKNNIKGRVVTKFIMNRYGKAQNLQIVKSLSPECDAEVIRVLSEMPVWKPAIKDGKPVNVNYTIPITFNF